ncbi:hypothetical protein WR25_16585 [Diploscapter pachys]|uniref:TFIIS N-terminal domain-containing protein n=1 Tax=Diploscapter pachys TaxID=2018661 RepID=A0A2A2LAN6_9BILA|nr:hypothetical protein WR25_16585 [Diploscapter pachys]
MMTPSVQVPSTSIPSTASSIDQLKQELQNAVFNADCESALRVVDEMAKICINRELLESTRVGALVNELRKKTGEEWPTFNKKCRALIKSWQKIAEVARPSSSCNSSSNNATPNLVSPATFSRKVTPCTPLNRLVTSTGLPGNKSATVSPATSSYAPSSKKEQISPLSATNANHLHKSQSVGVELLLKGEDYQGSASAKSSPALQQRNGKRKPDNISPATSIAANTPIKRTKTAVGSLVSPATPSSVSDARKAVQSTSELVAQLSMGLPQHMNIDSTIRQHEERVKREHLDEEYAMQLSSNVPGSPYVQPERKKRKYERKQKPEQPPATVAPAGGERRGGLILRFSRSSKGDSSPVIIKSELNNSREATPLGSVSPSIVAAPESNHVNGDVKKASPKTHVEDSEDVATMKAPSEVDGVDWMAQLPSLDELRQQAEEEKRRKEEAKRKIASNKVYLMKVHSRDVLALPYLESTGGDPDFIRFKYPNSSQFIFDDIGQGSKD